MNSGIQKITASSMLVLSFLFSSASLAGGQDVTSEFEEGPLQSRRAALETLIQLKIKGDSIVLKREWGKGKEVGDKEDRLDAEVKRLAQKGIDGQIADQMARRMLRHSLDFEHPMLGEFEKLKGERMSGSAGRSVSNNRISTYFNNRVLGAKLNINNSKIQFTMQENEEPGREVDVTDDNNGGFKMKYTGNDFTAELRQESDGAIRLTRIRGDEAEVFTADNYVALQKKHPKVVDEWLIPVFMHLGFTVPVSVADDAVRSTVLAKLTGMRSRSMSDFKKLLKDLDAEEFQTRESATDKLAAQAEIWEDAIRKELKSRDLSVEARARLKNILADATTTNPTDELILSQGLLNSPEYLVSLFEIANEAEASAITKQLEEITGHSAATPDAWRDWLENKK